jgi:hypothetical protein
MTCGETVNHRASHERAPLAGRRAEKVGTRYGYVVEVLKQKQ